MKKKIIIITAIVIAVAATVTAFVLARRSAENGLSDELKYKDSTYTLVKGWSVPDGAQGIKDKASSNGKEYDVTVYGDNSEFLSLEYYDNKQLVDVTQIYHKQDSALPDVSKSEIKDIYLNYADKDVKSSDPEISQKLSDLISNGDYISEQLSGTRFLCSIKLEYKDCPLLCSVGSVVGVEDKYYFRLDFIDGKYSDEKRYYPVEPGYLA